MFIRVVIKEVRYIHELSLTLEHLMPVSSPAVLVLTLTVLNHAEKNCLAILLESESYSWKLNKYKNLTWSHVLVTKINWHDKILVKSVTKIYQHLSVIENIYFSPRMEIKQS